MFCENDIDDNNSNFRYKKNKPQYKLIDNNIVLTSTPVIKQVCWSDTQPLYIKSSSIKNKLKTFLLNSHLLHDLYFRYNNRFYDINKHDDQKIDRDLTITRKILNELKSDVEKKGASLLIVLIPSKREVENTDNYIPYQIDIINICKELNIYYFDLAPYFKKNYLRTYYRIGMHWNSRGHRVAANALLNYLNK